MKNLFLVTLSLFSTICIANKQDSIAYKNLEMKVQLLSNQLEEVRRDELNYKLEKDLLKETYSNNFEKLNFMVTALLGIIGLLGYLGIRDINSIKN